ncbi:hypothetical protein [Azospirillum argentinense]
MPKILGDVLRGPATAFQQGSGLTLNSSVTKRRFVVMSTSPLPAGA